MDGVGFVAEVEDRGVALSHTLMRDSMGGASSIQSVVHTHLKVEGLQVLHVERSSKEENDVPEEEVSYHARLALRNDRSIMDAGWMAWKEISLVADVARQLDERSIIECRMRCPLESFSLLGEIDE